MDGAQLQAQIDDLKNEVKMLRAKIQALVDDTGKVLQYEPENYTLITEEQVKKDMPTAQSY